MHFSYSKSWKNTPSLHGRWTFCRKCYQLGHIKKDCCLYQCPHCLLFQPNHDEDGCLQNSLLLSEIDTIIVKKESHSPPPLMIPSPSTIKKPYFPPPRQSSHQNNKSSSTNSSGSSRSNGVKKKKYKRKSKDEVTWIQESLDRDVIKEFRWMDSELDGDEPGSPLCL